MLTYVPSVGCWRYVRSRPSNTCTNAPSAELNLPYYPLLRRNVDCVIALDASADSQVITAAICRTIYILTTNASPGSVVHSSGRSARPCYPSIITSADIPQNSPRNAVSTPGRAAQHGLPACTQARRAQRRRRASPTTKRPPQTPLTPSWRKRKNPRLQNRRTSRAPPTNARCQMVRSILLLTHAY